MTPREEAGVQELRLMLEHLDRRNAQNAGDAAELKAALAQAAAKVVDQPAASVVEAPGAEAHPPQPDANQTARLELAALAQACGVNLTPEHLQPANIAVATFAPPVFTAILSALASRVAAIEAGNEKG